MPSRITPADAINAYLRKIQENLASGIASEDTHRSALENLLESLDPTIRAFNDPKHISVGAPDFTVRRKGNATDFPVGWLETKDIGEDLNKAEKSEQLERYFGLPNLILTDYLEFRWFVDGKLRLKAQLATPGRSGRLRRDADGEQQVSAILSEFLSYSLATLATPQELAQRMAKLAHLIRDVLLRSLGAEPSSGHLHNQLEAFRETLIPDLKPDQFADMYAQTIAYGLFAARCQSSSSSKEFGRAAAADLIPRTNPFLRRLFREIAFELDPRVQPFVDDLVALLRHAEIGKIMEDFGKRTAKEDPVVHFYEDFLQEYDPKVREMRGVYYTPEPVVSYIVRSVDHLLKTRFAKPMGLADKDVLILDPACGTGTFLYYVIRHIHGALVAAGQKGQWNRYVTENLLKRVFGFELLMAPYAVAHLKLGLLLQDLGYKFESNERLGVYLTNTLEEAIKKSEKVFAEWISEEANAASEIKREKPIMVVLGNPPYSNFGQLNRGTWILELLKDYKKGLKEKKLNLDDDFIKFIRFGQWRIQKTGYGILAFISNNTYVDGITHRRMRESLLDTFNETSVLNLHGDSRKRERSPDGGPDENVFDIMQGVAIGLFVKQPGQARPATKYRDLYGSRAEKYSVLEQTDISTTNWITTTPTPPHWFFAPQITSGQDEYASGWLLSEVMKGISGIETKRDAFAMDFDVNSLKKRIEDFVEGDYTPEERKSRFDVRDNEWVVQDAVTLLRKDTSWRNSFVPCLYRPFDKRWLIYNSIILARDRGTLMASMNRPNLGLIAARQSKEPFAVLASESVCTHKIVTVYDRSFLFPLYIYEREATEQKQLIPGSGKRTTNFTNDFITAICSKLELSWKNENAGDLINTIGNADVFHYIYAVLHSPTYRERYAQFLKIGFPRIPLTAQKPLFRKLTEAGKELLHLHLMDSPKLASLITSYEQPGEHRVEKIHYVEPNPKVDIKSGQVYINSKQFFQGVPKEVWDFHIGGYQVCEKWLKDRKGRTLSSDDIDHYQKIIVAIIETIRIMREIDDLIPAWPLP